MRIEMFWKNHNPFYFFGEPHIAKVRENGLCGFFNRYNKLESDIFMVILGDSSFYYPLRTIKRMEKYK